MSLKPPYVLEGRIFYFDFFFENSEVEQQVRIIGPELPAYATILKPEEENGIQILVESNWSHDRLAYWREHPELKATITLSFIHLPGVRTEITGLTLSKFGGWEDDRPKPHRADEALWYSMKQ